jgi:hypothetical protein
VAAARYLPRRPLICVRSHLLVEAPPGDVLDEPSGTRYQIGAPARTRSRHAVDEMASAGIRAAEVHCRRIPLLIPCALMRRFLTVPAAVLVVMLATISPAESSGLPSQRSLSGVACSRTTSCWAVGSQTASGVTRTLIEHWNGRKWSPATSPSLAGSAATFLLGVFCRRAADCWAVGGAQVGSSSQKPIAEHWNGRKWSLTVLPEPSGAADDPLFSIWCPAATRCWAVGAAAKKQGTPSRPLTEHWTGRKWTVVATPAVGGLNLIGLFCHRDTDCWAVGGGAMRGLAEHWNGHRWSVAATPATGGGLSGIWCPGTDCIAAGNSGYPSAMTERWNGRKWSLTPTA